MMEHNKSRSNKGDVAPSTPSDQRELEQIIALAKYMHYEYEMIASRQKWETQESTRVDFDELPESNKAVMLELAGQIFENQKELLARECAKGRLEELVGLWKRRFIDREDGMLQLMQLRYQELGGGELNDAHLKDKRDE